MTHEEPVAVGVAAEELRAALTGDPPRLPAAYFYDARGSRLFEEITQQPEYYLTDAERTIFEHHAKEIADRVGEVEVVELGAGSGAKTRVLLEAFLARQTRVRYVPIDVSGAALDEAKASLAKALPDVEVEPLAMRYRAGLHRLREMDGEMPRLVLFIGSSLGNFDLDEATGFMAEIGSELSDRDAMLLGTDVPKDPVKLNPAYNDAAGVTAAFNLNLLRRLNNEYDADFDPDAWTHYAFYNPTKLRVEMHLVSLRAQTVRIPGLNLTMEFPRGASIHTENSHKFSPARLDRVLQESGLRVERTWTDPDDLFAEHLLRKSPE